MPTAGLKEIDRTLRKVDEGVKEFAARYRENQGAKSSVDREAHKEALRKANAALQKHGAQIQKWTSAGDESWKAAKSRLQDAQAKIEKAARQMAELEKREDADTDSKSGAKASRSPSPDPAEVKILAEQLIRDGNLDSDFLEEAICKICQVNLVHKPKLTRCSHLFCGDCIKMWFDAHPGNQTWAQRASAGGTVPCPVCKEPLNYEKDLFPVCAGGRSENALLWRMLCSLKIVCSNSAQCRPDDGRCDWRGDYGGWQKHISSCQNYPTQGESTAAKEKSPKSSDIYGSYRLQEPAAVAHGGAEGASPTGAGEGEQDSAPTAEAPAEAPSAGEAEAPVTEAPAVQEGADQDPKAKRKAEKVSKDKAKQENGAASEAVPSEPKSSASSSPVVAPSPTPGVDQVIASAEAAAKGNDLHAALAALVKLKARQWTRDHTGSAAAPAAAPAASAAPVARGQALQMQQLQQQQLHQQQLHQQQQQQQQQAALLEARQQAAAQRQAQAQAAQREAAQAAQAAAKQQAAREVAQAAAVESSVAAGTEVLRVQTPFNGNPAASQLQVKVGDGVVVLEKHASGWYYGRKVDKDSTEGWFPHWALQVQ